MLWRRIAAHYAGFIAGPLAWAINVELGQILPYPECRLKLPLLAAISWALALLVLAASATSWQSEIDPERRLAESGRVTRAFTKNLSSLIGALFALALLLQGLSSVVLSGCER